jgi:hypothetical protein
MGDTFRASKATEHMLLDSSPTTHLLHGVRVLTSFWLAMGRGFGRLWMASRSVSRLPRWL